MINTIDSPEEIKQLVLKQLSNFWTDTDEKVISNSLPAAIEAVRLNFKSLPNKRFSIGGNAILSPYISVQWMIFLYRLAHQIYIDNRGDIPKEADQIYYLNKAMHANDWFYAIDLPTHFMCEHPLGSVLGRADYGDYLFVYQGTTIGGNRKKGDLSYPVLGNNVILYANSTILGDSHIGNNVVVSSGTYIINEIIPDNCIVFGKSPNLTIKIKSEDQIKQYTQHIWGWEGN